ncbi:MAG TPA: rod shape-determining protein MreC [Dehalococcoidia bacterium]|nr:rod shape-determining protein MreC [Dehalococcoidia bacterium]
MTARTLAWTGFIAIAAFVLLAASRLALLDPVENVTLGVTAPVQNVLHDATQPVADWVNNFTDASALSRENKDLRAENERLTNELARAREEMQQAQNARDLDAIKRQFPDDQFLQASVIARTSSNVRSVVAIDRGANDGLREGMIVVTEGRSLVGTVTRVFDGYAWVTLITDPKSAVSAMIQESRAEGVVAGNYDGSLNMEFVGQGAAVKDGDFVITSGIGGGYPPGIVIGRVSGVEKTEQDLFQKVHVDHLASLAKLEQVLVITSFEPKALQGP